MIDIDNEEVELEEEDSLAHYGTKYHSGRYPWGSGDNPYQRSGDFISRIDSLRNEGKSDKDIAGALHMPLLNLKTQETAARAESTDKKGMSEKEIAEALGITTTELRIQRSLAYNQRQAMQAQAAKSMLGDGYSRSEVAKKLGYNNESSIRALLKEGSDQRRNKAMATADLLKSQIDNLKDGEVIDIGASSEKYLNISRERLNEALYILNLDGYKTFTTQIPQTTNPGNFTTYKFLAKPDATEADVKAARRDKTKIKALDEVTNVISRDGGDTYEPAFKYPKSMDSKRLMVKYGDEGGVNRDGVIEIRRGVPDLSLGTSNFAQVRILVDGTHYLKGMAVYADDLPPGIDIRFNTNKPKGTPMLGDDKNNTVLKKIKKDDPNNPFGSNLKEHGGQSTYIDENGKEQLSLINKTREAGDWGEWADKVPSQFLAKQPIKTIKTQLNVSIADKENELEEIQTITNPSVKIEMLNKFAESCDREATALSAAAFPSQKYQVILPVDSLKDNEVYAPNYKDGEKLALIRFPHAGTFEIPIVTVNNKNAEAKKVIGSSPEETKDAIGINSRVAQRLSGADFDGDTVMVIPTGKNGINIQSKNQLAGLENFDHLSKYAYHEGMKILPKDQVGKQMGQISNLITDMTVQGATDDELARAVRHSMVVIDANKHALDYKQSEIDNDIRSLKEKYQGHYNPQSGRMNYGANTLFSKSTSEDIIPERREGAYIKDPKTGKIKLTYIDPETGEKLYRNTNRKFASKDKNGNWVYNEATNKVEKMRLTNDANTLSSGTEKEAIYADYANRLKAMANEARKETLHVEPYKHSSEAAKLYADEVNQLKSFVNISEKNRYLERKAQLIASDRFKAILNDNPEIKEDKEYYKKLKDRCLKEARISVGAHRHEINLTDKQWEAIQAGAISRELLKSIIKYSKSERLNELAVPKQSKQLSSTKVRRLKNLAASGCSASQIADTLGISVSSVHKYLTGEGDK